MRSSGNPLRLNRRRYRSRLSGLAVVVLLIAAPAVAQEPRSSGSRAVAFDTVIGVQDFFADDGRWLTQAVVDASGTVELAPGLQATVRAKLWRVNGTWEAPTDQASIRYEIKKGSDWRLEAGRFASSVGLGMTENRPNLNAGLLWCHRPYYMPLPSFGAETPRLSLVSAVYPYGAQVSTSTSRWDARAALVDRAPIEFWQQSPGTPRRMNLVIGGGLTPKQGLRLGVTSAVGRLPAAPASGGDASSYRLFNIEGEFAFAATKLSGEWTRDTVHLPGGAQSAHGWTLQAKQTLSPRFFAHSRASTVASPAATGGTFQMLEYRSLDTTLGYLVNPEVTVRVGHAALKPYTGTAVDHQVGVSLMWSRRWW
jgi:hypothetical protein